MQTAPHAHGLNMPSPRSLLIMSALCLNMLLVACDKNEPVQQAETPTSIEVIPQDLIAVQSGNSVQKTRSEEHTSELQSRENLVCRLLLDYATLVIYTLSLHDALPISCSWFKYAFSALSPDHECTLLKYVVSGL